MLLKWWRSEAGPGSEMLRAAAIILFVSHLPRGSIICRVVELDCSCLRSYLTILMLRDDF
jgi:hypothetical protein